MRLFPLAIDIGDDEGFTPEKDIFRRAEFGKRLVNLVRAIEDPAVIVLDAPWGAGKTTFVRMWRGELTKLGIRSVYFDAFASDYMDDAFVALAGEILSLANQNLRKESKAAKSFKRAAIEAGRDLSQSAIKLGVRAATMGLLSGDEVEKAGDLAKSIAEEASKAAESLLERQFDRYTEQKATLETFRTRLSELADELRSSSKLTGENRPPNESTRAPVVFIIDELDRCKPPFALALIEVIKHFFSVPGIVFLIVTHMDQLANAVRAAYGSEIDAPGYLEKFYHLRVLPPEGRDGDHLNETIYSIYLRHVFDALPKDSENGQYTYNLIDHLAEIARLKGFSLRRLERVATNAALVLASTKDNYFRVASLVAGLCVLRVETPSLYDKARTDRLTYQEVAAALQLNDLKKRISDGRAAHIDALWKVCLNEPAGEDQNLDYVHREFWRFSLSPDQAIPALCRFIDEFNFPGT